MPSMTRKIADDARALGVRKGSALLVHSSFRSLGGGVTAKEVVDGLREALGPGGTLVFPTLSYLFVGPAHARAFDVRTTPSNVGYLPEYFRTQIPDVRRSLGPTHSCAAVGEKRDFLVGEHSLDDTPAGEHSPFRRLLELDGSILFLGCGTNCNTSMHAVEELSRPPYLFEDRYDYELTDETGKTVVRPCYAHDFQGVSQQYRRMEDLLTGDELRTGNILQAPCHLMRCAPLWEKADAKLREDPFWFVDRI